MTSQGRPSGSLARTLTRGQAVTIGMGSMVGAGLFVVWTPASAAAGPLLLLSLLLAALVAGANAWSSAVLAARYPAAGGTYVYASRRLGEAPGFLAGWCFVVGKSASCVAMALTVGLYVAPDYARLAAVVSVLAVTTANLSGVHRSAEVSRAVVALVLSVLAGLAVSVLVAQRSGAEVFTAAPPGEPGVTGAYGVLQAAGLLFFAFAGYARIATLGEEVRDPQRTIGQAIALTFVIVLTVYLVVAMLVLGVLGPADAARHDAPLAEVAARVWDPGWVWLVRFAAAVAAFGALLNLLLGISRTTLAMARDGHLPAVLARVDGVRGLPRAAEVTVAAVVIVVALSLDVRGAIGFSSFGVLLYYAATNASALTLRGARRVHRIAAVAGLVGCLVLVATLPWTSVLSGLVVLSTGLVWYAVARRARSRRDGE
ncbi:MAG TPA: APC family permease [Ornithinimicrobium sp.]|uniref:APC family permease n=1 Tax=Ornithinimicrobium sp. TaxID=1977084 RepID=UPI002B486713|nr:APC family permease [Ornithinimicrobium sp.]HKJ11744.1 APC family permease [Ornithinimicrobium sp.]